MPMHQDIFAIKCSFIVHKRQSQGILQIYKFRYMFISESLQTFLLIGLQNKIFIMMIQNRDGNLQNSRDYIQLSLDSDKIIFNILYLVLGVSQVCCGLLKGVLLPSAPQETQGYFPRQRFLSKKHSTHFLPWVCLWEQHLWGMNLGLSELHVAHELRFGTPDLKVLIFSRKRIAMLMCCSRNKAKSFVAP